MDLLAEWVAQTLSISPALAGRLLASLLAILAILLLRPLAMALVTRRTDDPATLYRWRKTAEYTALLLGLFALGRIWLISSQSLATYLGLLTAGLAIALQDPISNFFGWLFILGRRPFDVGDRIEVGDVAGDVVDIRFFQFSLLEIGKWVDADQSTGRVIHVPNKLVFSTPLANYSRGFTYIWHEIPVTVTFESDWHKAKELLLSIVREQGGVLAEAARQQVRQAARRYMINYDKLTPTVYTRVAPHGVTLTLRYLVDPRQRRATEEALWEAILDGFAAAPDIALAYPTQRLYYQPQEGPRAAPQ